MEIEIMVSLRASVATEKRVLIEEICAHSATTPSLVAMECGSRSLTYRALHQRIAQRLRELSEFVSPGSFTTIERGRSIDFVVDFLAVLAAGGTPVPIDPALPQGRRERLLDRIRQAAPAPGDGAYVFFTSGSTGTPKPVLGSAAALRSFLEWHCAEFGITPDDRVAFLTALSFDVSVRDMFLPLFSGATLVIPDEHEAATPEATVEWLRRQQISVVNVVPSVARSWLRHGRGTCDAVRTVFFAGEPLTGGLLEEWRAMFPRTLTRVNFYGTTETTLPKVYKRLLPGEPAGPLPAGVALPGGRFCLIDPDGPFDAETVCADWEEPRTTGEIVLVSKHSGHGYLDLPQENAARFADLGLGVTAYRTGDLGRVDENGELVVVGRTDDEVKINGVRIHPAEVEAAIRVDSRFGEVAVTAQDGRLTAYLAGPDLDVAELRRGLVTTLPTAMIPTRFVRLDALPTLPNGKVDREALRDLDERPPGVPFAEPIGEIEGWLAAQWPDLFGRGEVSANADFFAAGGDSIAAMRLAARIRRDLGITVTVREIFAASTFAGIAAEIADRQLLAVGGDELLAMLSAVEGVACHE
jgi:acyl-coenzyme A synthetase/AMP-(fatty) acid ligase/aryl carrier-like protein